MKDKYIVIAAITGLTIMEVVALFKGINGTLLLVVMAAVAGLAGWVMPAPKIIEKLKGGR